MRKFDIPKFCCVLRSIRKNKTQKALADAFGVNRSTFSLIENGKQLPSIEFLNRVCEITGHSSSDFFVNEETDALIYLMGTLEEEDKVKISEMEAKIRIKEKYASLYRRCV